MGIEVCGKPPGKSVLLEWPTWCADESMLPEGWPMLMGMCCGGCMMDDRAGSSSDPAGLVALAKVS